MREESVHEAMRLDNWENKAPAATHTHSHAVINAPNNELYNIGVLAAITSFGWKATGRMQESEYKVKCSNGLQTHLCVLQAVLALILHNDLDANCKAQQSLFPLFSPVLEIRNHLCSNSSWFFKTKIEV